MPHTFVFFLCQPSLSKRYILKIPFVSLIQKKNNNILCLKHFFNKRRKKSDGTNCCFAGVLYQQFVLVCIAVIYMTSYGLHLPRHLHYPELHYVTLHFITLHYITLHYTTLHYSGLHCTTLHWTTLHHPALHSVTLHCTESALGAMPRASGAFEVVCWSALSSRPITDIRGAGSSLQLMGSWTDIKTSFSQRKQGWTSLKGIAHKVALEPGQHI